MSFYCNKNKISILLTGLIFFCNTVNGQNQETATGYWQKQDLPAARDAVEQWLQQEPSNPKALLLKARILNAMSNDPALKYSLANGRMDAWQALQKAVKLDAAHVEKELAAEQYALPLQLYKGIEDEGIAIFNTALEVRDSSVYAQALGCFRKAGQLSSAIYASKWGLQAIDSNNLFYGARAAIYAGKDEDATMYARKIAAAGIVETKDNKGFEPIYQWLVYHYRQENNGEKLKQYTDQGIALYPQSAYFDLNYIDWLREQKRTGELLQRYNGMFDRGIYNTSYRYAYLVDLFNNVSASPAYQPLLRASLASYIYDNPAEVKGKLLAGKYYINEAAGIQQSLAAIPATDKTQRTAARRSMIAALRSSNQYLLEIAEKFSKTDRSVYNEALNLLVANFTTLGDKASANKYMGKIK